VGEELASSVSARAVKCNGEPTGIDCRERQSA
jgi:hypothetical protein